MHVPPPTSVLDRRHNSRAQVQCSPAEMVQLEPRVPCDKMVTTSTQTAVPLSSVSLTAWLLLARLVSDAVATASERLL